MQPRSVEFRFLAEPTHVNFGGKVHGGMVMKWLDQAAYACAARWSGLYCVTVSVGTIRFRRPILVGHLVELEAKVVHTGSTSMHIFVQVRSGDSKSGELAETNHCIITFVALDEQGNTAKVPVWQPETPEDKFLEQYAIQMKQFSQTVEQQMLDFYQEQQLDA
ncbi:acyl-CoA thioesterase [Rheinheimera sp.]|jgi:acyl-CoA hydrolase|uniref:acyl-CoA thioesterase n=1 Tax=Rheinheimera sp. TaxID=1869214 RepID=UPI003D2B69F5